MSKEVEKFLATIYKEYLYSRKRGNTRSESLYFGDSVQLHKTIFSEITIEDISEICWELHRQNYLHCDPGDDLANDVMLTDDGISFMETKFKNGIKDVLSFLSQFIP